MAKSRQLYSISEISRKYNCSRQSVRNWVERHEDFPSAVIGDGAKLKSTSKKNADIVYLVNDPGGRTKFFDISLVDAWVKNHGASLRSQGAKPAAVAAPKPAGKKSKVNPPAKALKSSSKAASKPSATKKPASKPVRAAVKAEKVSKPARKAEKLVSVKKKGKKAKKA